MKWGALAAVALMTITTNDNVVSAREAPTARPWLNPRLSPDARARLVLAQMTQDEKIALVFGQFATDFPPRQFKADPAARFGSAGYVPGVPRLGIPAQWETDAGIGVATQGGSQRKRERTSLPSNLATAATWNPELAFQGGAMIGEEAFASGFNVMLAGGANLAREPRNGRNFEYGGEDPLLAGTMVGAQVAGIQSRHVVSTLKHYALNDQETDRNAGNSVIDPAAARQSDLLAFQFALERSNAGAVMCSYNKVNGTHSCENPWLLTEVLRRDWGFKGYVMSDWGGVHSTAPAVAAGLDQQSGWPFDREPYLGSALKEAIASAKVAPAQLDTMVTRILRSMFAHGLVDHVAANAPWDLPKPVLAAHAAVSRADAEEAIVLLKNQETLLPLSPTARRIVVIGGHADKGVLSGGGSGQVSPVGGNPVPGLGPKFFPGPIVFDPDSPLTAIRAQAPNAEVTFVDGGDSAAAAKAAREADVAIVFATQWAAESFDVSLALGDNQDALIQAVAAANPKTVVVLETGGAVLTPWRGEVGALLAAWYPGSAGGQAIARVLFGKVNPSGHLPVTFPDALAQLPHPEVPHAGDILYKEGATVGYKWLDARGQAPAYAFGEGLSYTRFALSGLAASAQGNGVTARFTVRNLGSRQGKAVAQIYVAGEGWEAPKRLGGFAKVALAPGATAARSVTIDPRLFATFDESARQWRIAGGTYRVMLAPSSREVSQTVTVRLAPRTLPAGWRPLSSPK